MSFPHRIARSNAMIVATAPSIISVDFSLSGLMFPAGSVRIKMLLKNISPKVASGMLGHSDSRTTLDIYSHLLTDMQKPVINALNDTFKDITVTKQ